MTTPRLPESWPEIALRVKADAGWKCERCRHDHDPLAGVTLGAFHLDGDKANNADWNLAALCRRRQLHFQGKPLLGQLTLFDAEPWLNPHREGYLASIAKERG